MLRLRGGRGRRHGGRPGRCGGHGPPLPRVRRRPRHGGRRRRHGLAVHARGERDRHPTTGAPGQPRTGPARRLSGHALVGLLHWPVAGTPPHPATPLGRSIAR
ncbi:hypothetical protein DEI81_13395 [Curtobacterium sp. MCBD17_013]|nr:hypothetical protein DEI82_02100 [Curtobacterium sp. MCBD17_019]PZF60027.1 hypothetical protein DEI81_13395 [Curtobacterium sp. MCBD17_013]